MNSDDATAAVVDALESLGIPYMLVGSLSSNFYGLPRATQDADFVVEMSPGSLSSLMKRLGEPFRLDPQTAFEMVTATRQHVLRLADAMFSVELFELSDDAHDRERFQRRRRVRVLERDACVPTVEDVIVTKLRWSQGTNRGKDVDDVRNVIAVQNERID